MKKIFTYNSTILLILIIIIELFFGHWFDQNNFGIHMRKHRNIHNLYEVKFNNKNYKFIYKRNFYGFRGNEIENFTDIKFVFLGGSTGNEKLLPEKLTIVGQINKLFKNKIQIINGSVDGKTLNGHYNDFKYWFTKLNNFKPQYFIIYAGINDSVIDQPGKYDNTFEDSILKNIRDYIVNNSIFIDLSRKVKNKYFSTYNFKYDISNSSKLYDNFIYKNYSFAKKIHNTKNLENYHKELSDRYKTRINKLIDTLDQFGSKIIFITQVKYDGLNDEKLFMLNEILKKISVKKNINIIKLDEMFEGEKGDFFDEVHTTPQGSEKIANIIYNELNKIIFPY